MAVRDLTARTTIKDRLWVRIYIFIYIYFYFFIFSIEFFEGVSRGGPYRWSMDRSVRWSVDPVRWTGPRTGGQCFRVTLSIYSSSVAMNLRTVRISKSKKKSTTRAGNNKDGSFSDSCGLIILCLHLNI